MNGRQWERVCLLPFGLVLLMLYDMMHQCVLRMASWGLGVLVKDFLEIKFLAGCEHLCAPASKEMEHFISSICS